MSVLNLTESPAAACWRLTKARLQADTNLGVSGANVLIEFAEDCDALTSPENLSVFPAIQVYGSLGQMRWYHEAQHAGALAITFVAFVGSLDFADCANLSNALLTALYPDDGLVFEQSLRDAGAETGQWLITRPLSPSMPGRYESRRSEWRGEAVLAVKSPVLSM